MKQWPEGGKPANFSDLADVVCEAIHAAYKLRLDKRVFETGIPWNGPGSPGYDQIEQPAVALEAEHLRYANEDQGRDPLREIVAIAIQLGIEQGQRILEEKINERHMLIRMHLKPALKMIDRPLRYTGAKSQGQTI